MSAHKVLVLTGLYSLAMILGALSFQYFWGVLPCEMCHWQRWPHIGAAIVALGGIGLVMAGVVDRKFVPALVWMTLFLIAVTGLIGAYQAGVEWKFLPGPTSCTGDRYVVTGTADLTHAAPVVRCDVVQWSLFGISLAGYNAIFSLGIAALGAAFLMRSKK